MAEAKLCPHCGANLDISPDENDTVCRYCHSRIYIKNRSNQNKSLSQQAVTYNRIQKKWSKCLIASLVSEAILTILFALFMEWDQTGLGVAFLTLIITLCNTAAVVLGVNVPPNSFTGKKRNRAVWVFILAAIYFAVFWAVLTSMIALFVI